MATVDEREAARRDLLPGMVVPAWLDEEIVKKELEEQAKKTELFLRDPIDPSRPFDAGPPRLNPNHPLGKALQGTSGANTTLEVLLTMLVAKMAGFDIGVEVPKEEAKSEGRGARGSVAGGAPEGSVSSTPTTGPSATGGGFGRGRAAEDARAAAGQTREQRK